MKLQGYRKFIAVVLALISFTFVALLAEVDVFNLGLGLGILIGAHGGSDAVKEFARIKRAKK